MKSSLKKKEKPSNLSLSTQQEIDIVYSRGWYKEPTPQHCILGETTFQKHIIFADFFYFPSHQRSNRGSVCMKV